MCDLVSSDSRAIEVAPRRLLARQVERAREMGFRAKAGSELEMYLFRESYESARKKGYRDLETFGSYIEDYNILQGTKEEPLVGAIVRGLDASGIPMEGSKGEWGPGQQELNACYGDVLEQADANVLTKHAAKEIAGRQGFAVTFMAKWNEKLAGSSMHQHLSLWNPAGDENLFAGKSAQGALGSDLFRWFLGGWMAHAEELAALCAPTVNSYKRFQSASFAPTSVAWVRPRRRVPRGGAGDSL
jgi:glutamine synthetase